MGHDARVTLGTRRLAVHSGFSGSARCGVELTYGRLKIFEADDRPDLPDTVAPEPFARSLDDKVEFVRNLDVFGDLQPRALRRKVADLAINRAAVSQIYL